MGEFAIDLHHVEKVYRGKVRALAGIEMQVRPGEVFGLLGPNGAGKSTLVKIMMTVVRPTRATGTLLGSPIGHKPTLARVGYLPEHHQMPKYLTGRQICDFYGALAGVDRSTRKRRAKELLAKVGMDEWADQKIAKYSKGMQQRVGLAQALMNDPDLIVLDEPTDGVDPVGRREIRDVLVDLKHQGKTIFLNSHLLSELEMICDRVSILVQGEVAQQGNLDDLTAESQRYEVTVFTPRPSWIDDDPKLKAEPGSKAGTTKISVLTSEPADVQPIIDRLRREEAVIESVLAVRETLEDLFMRAVTDPVTGKTLAPGAAKSASKFFKPSAKSGETKS